MFVSLMGQTFQEDWRGLEHLPALIIISCRIWSGKGASGKAPSPVTFAAGSALAHRGKEPSVKLAASPAVH